MTSITALTAYTGGFAIIGWIAILLGKIMEAMYNLMYALGIQSLGVAIILFTIIIYTCMLPLTYKQQKFAKLSQKMNPELKAIQAKYKGKKDQASQQKMVEEQRELYDKYGISPTGSCLQLAIQLPILYALYRVIYNIPAYVGKVYSAFDGAISGIMGIDDYISKFDAIIADMNINLSVIRVKDPSLSAVEDAANIPNRIVDILYKFSDANWATLAGSESFSSIANALTAAQEEIGKMTTFLWINISETPQSIFTSNWSSHHFGLCVLALLIPILSGLTQFINVKLMPTQTQNVGGEADAMAQQMKMMNYMMPIISIIFTFSLPAGMGIYWITGAIVRTIYMLLLNKHFEKMDLSQIIEKNSEKAAKKKAKRAAQYEQMKTAAAINTKSLSAKSNADTSGKEEALARAAEARANAKPGSLSAKANLVKDFNERNTKK